MTESHPFTGAYVRRAVDADLDELLPALPAILLDGPKGVGKTETALQRCISVRRLDQAGARAIVEAQPDIVGGDAAPVLIDEWQRVPEVWDAVRRLVDEDTSGGRFLLTGSAPVIGTHSGAARIATLRMRPLALAERGVVSPSVSFADLLRGTAGQLQGQTSFTLSDYASEIVAGGFPGLRRLSGRALMVQLSSYVDRIVDRDMVEAGYRARRPAVVRSWLRAYAAATATTAAWVKIRDAATGATGASPAKTTAMAYTELLTQLRILDPVEAWLPTNNHFKRLTGAPKHYLADPALAARLLDRTDRDLLTGADAASVVPRDGTLLGALFENLAALSIQTYAQSCDARVHHLRTEEGTHEVDFVVEREHGVLAFEVKLSATIADRDVRHLLWLRDRLGGGLIDAVVLSTGTEVYRRPDGIAVIPLALLGP